MALLEPLTLGELTLPNRVVMAPLTRIRATPVTHVPGDLMAEMYAERASYGLLIAEATMVTESQSAFYSEPGVYNAEQVAGWKKTTDAVHAKGGRIFLQIWHGGRQAHPVNNNGTQPVAPSAIAVEGHRITKEFTNTEEQQPYVTPKELTTAEIAGVVADFVAAAKNAIAAGFDGVEIHAANGYLIDQFWRQSSNKRTDEYGGSQENRTRFMLEVVDAVLKVLPAGKVGIRLSPLNQYGGMKDEDPVGLVTYAAKELAKREVGYIHIMRADFFGPVTLDVVTPIRENYRGVVIANMGFGPVEAEEWVKSKKVDAIAFGTLSIANPDLPERIKAGKEVAKPNPAGFYSWGASPAELYTGYPRAE